MNMYSNLLVGWEWDIFYEEEQLMMKLTFMLIVWNQDC